MNRIKLVVLCCLLVLSARAEASKTYTVGPPSQAAYYVKHVVGFSSGQFLKFEGDVRLSSDMKTVEQVGVTIDADSLSTYNEEREQGLKGEEFLDTAAYPRITVQSKKVTKDKITADVTIRGKTKEIVFDYGYYGVQLVDGAETTLVVLKGTIDRRDFGVDYNVKSEKTGKDLLGTDFEITLYLNAVLAK